MACEELFRGIDEKKEGGDAHEFQVTTVKVRSKLDLIY